MTLLKLTEVTRSFPIAEKEPLEILKGINLTVEPGDHISIVGRSGSGKSTLLNLLGILDSPTSGTVEFGGKDLAKLSQRKRDLLRGRSVGFVFQQFNLLHRRTALDNVIMPLMYSSGKQYWSRKKTALNLLERVGLGERTAHLVDQLSGGEQQRVAIARALVRSPQLILSDEPTGALDLETGDTVMSLLEQVSAETGAALITITHDVNIAARSQIHYRLDGGVLNAVNARKLEQAEEVLSGKA